MRQQFFPLLLLVMLNAGLASAEVRVGIVTDDDSARDGADLLTTALTGTPGLTLLERNEVQRVFREQTIPGTRQTDFLQIGRLLRADGLILLQSARHQTNSDLGVRLVSVNTGVVLDAAIYSRPLRDPEQWSQIVAARFAPLMQKLDVPRDRAVPISILNLRAALATSSASETERSLNTLLFHHLAQERELFVLERRQMEKLQWEKDLPGPDDQPFWNGSYLLEGVIDRDGPAPNVVTIHARLTPPDGTNIVNLEVSGPRDDLPAVVEQLTARVLAALKRQTSVRSWDRDAEAARFEKEAAWATTWKMWPEAAAAAESAWALGHRTLGNAALRVKALLAQADTTEELVFDPVRNYGWAENPPPPEALSSASAAVEAYMALCQSTADTAWRTNPAWLDLGLDTLRASSLVLRHWYHFDVRKGVYDEPAFPILRSAVRDLAAILPPGTRRTKLRELFPGYSPPVVPEDCNSLEMARGVFGPLWQDTPRETISLYQEMLDSGSFDRQLKHIVGRDWVDPVWVAWTPAERESGPGLWKSFIAGLESSTNRALKTDGALLALQSARFDPDMAQAIETFLDATMENQPERFVPAVDYSVVDVFDQLLKAKCGQKPITRRREQFLAEWKSLRFACMKNYLQTVEKFDQYRGGEDILRAWFTQDEARELLPVAEEYARRFPTGEKIGQVVQHVRDLTTNTPDPYAEFFGDQDFNAGRYQELFLNHDFTPAEAQRVLPGFLDYMIHGHGQNDLYVERDKLRTIAADAAKPAPPSAAPPPVVFNWNHVIVPETREENPPRKSQSKYLKLYPYEGHIFAALEVYDFLYRSSVQNFDGGLYDLYEIDPITGDSRELVRRIPEMHDVSPPSFDVTHEKVFWVESATTIGSVDRVTGKVQRFTVDLPSGYTFVRALGSRVFLTSADFIAELFPHDGSLKLLASKRRNPPANRLDAAGWTGFPDVALGSNGVLTATMDRQVWTYNGATTDWTLLAPPTNSVGPATPLLGVNYWDIRRWSRPYRFSNISLNKMTSVSNFDGTNLWVLAANKSADRQFTLFWFDPAWELPREIPIMSAMPRSAPFASSFGTRIPTVAFMPQGLFLAPDVIASGANCFWFIPWDDLKNWAKSHCPDSRNLSRREPALMATYDTNHDGILDTNELEAMYDDPAWKRADAEFQARRLLYSFDTNDDGTLEGDELVTILRLGLGFSAYRPARANQPVPPAFANRGPLGRRQVPLDTLAPTVPKLLERFDRNHDQALDADELTDVFVAINSPSALVSPGNATGTPGRNGFPASDPPPTNAGAIRFRNPQSATNSVQPIKP